MAVGRALSAAGSGGGVSPGEALLAEAVHFIDWGAATANDGAVAPNINDATPPSRNLITFSTGPIVNEAGSAAPTRTPFYSVLNDAQGTTNATRLVSTGTNQNFFLYRAGTCPAIPNGTYGIRFRCRATAGGPFTINYGLSSALTAGSAQNLDWDDSANTAATTMEAEFTWAGTGDITIRIAASGADIQVDRIQVYFGGLAAIPAWSDENISGGRKAFAFEDSFTIDGDGNWLIATGEAGGWIMEPGLSPKTYSEVTMIHVAGYDEVATGAIAYALTVPQDTINGTTLASSLNLAFEATVADYSGETTFKPGTTSRALTGLNVLDQGIVTFGQSISATQRTRYFGAVPVTDETVAFSPVAANCWLVGSGSTTLRAHLATFQAYGPQGFSVIFDRALTPTEYAQAEAALRVRMASRNLGVFNDFHVISGDSNATRATGDWTQLITASGFFTPEPNLWMANTSVGGEGLDELEAGRFANIDAPKLLAAANMGKKAAYHLVVGTNDFTDMVADVNAYWARRQALIDDALALHPNVSVIDYTVIPRSDAIAGVGFEAARQSLRTLQLAYAAANSTRVFISDFGDPTNGTIGDKALQEAGGGTYYNADQTHFIAAGDVVAANIARDAVEAWRLSVLP